MPQATLSPSLWRHCHRRIAEPPRRWCGQLNANSNHYNKLVRTNVALVECLKRYRGNGEQKVTVTHNHVTVNADQAAVAVNHPGGGGTVLEERRQPDVKATDPAALAYAAGAALPCEVEADKAVVPATRG